MTKPSTDSRKVRARLRRYERKLRDEKKQWGDYRDGAGHRYDIGPLYMVLGDDEAALAAFRWFEKEFPDDAGEPGHALCWSLALHRSGDEAGAARKLRQTMLSNLYLLPHLLGAPMAKLDIWHSSNFKAPEYVASIPEPYLRLWSEEEREWAAKLRDSLEFTSVRARDIEIGAALGNLRPGPERSRLVREMRELMG